MIKAVVFGIYAGAYGVVCGTITLAQVPAPITVDNWGKTIGDYGVSVAVLGFLLYWLWQKDITAREERNSIIKAASDREKILTDANDKLQGYIQQELKQALNAAEKAMILVQENVRSCHSFRSKAMEVLTKDEDDDRDDKSVSCS